MTLHYCFLSTCQRLTLYGKKNRWRQYSCRKIKNAYSSYTPTATAAAAAADDDDDAITTTITVPLFVAACKCYDVYNGLMAVVTRLRLLIQETSQYAYGCF